MPLTITINEAAPGTLTIGVGTPGVGVPAGGTAGQVLTKVNSTDYNTVFATPSADFITAVTAPLSVTSGNLSVNLSTYLPLAGGTMDANATIELSDTTTATVSEVGGYGFAVSSSSNINLKTNVLFDRVLVAGAVSATTIKPTGVEFPDLTLQTSAGISAATAAANFYPLTGNPSGFLTSAPVTSVAGMTGAVVLSNTDISGLGTMSTATAADYSTTVQADGLYYPLSGNPSAFLTDAPSDGSTYGRNNGAWAVAGGGGFITSVTAPLSVTSNDLSVDLSAYLPLAGGAMTGNSTITVGANVATLGASNTNVQVVGSNSYGSTTHTSSLTGTGVNLAYTGNGPYGAETGTGSLDYQQLSLAFNSASAVIGSAVINVSGTSGSLYNLGTTQTWSLTGANGLAWNNGTQSGAFNASGITFPDATVQSTAAVAGIPDAPSDGSYYGRLNASWSAFIPGFTDAPSDGSTYGRNNGAWAATPTNPGFTNSVWTGGTYVSANVTNIPDANFNYWNVLTF